MATTNPKKTISEEDLRKEINDALESAARLHLTLIKTGIGLLITIVTTMGTAVMYIDARYAHTVDVAAIQETQNKTIQDIKREYNEQLRSLRTATLEDKIFELEMKTTRTPSEDAVIQRYKRELSLLNNNPTMGISDRGSAVVKK